MRSLLAAAAVITLAGLINACTSGIEDEEVGAVAEGSALKGAVTKNTRAVVTCKSTPLLSCADPKKCKVVTTLAKGRKVEIVLDGAPEKGRYRVQELKNDKRGRVLGSCLKKTADGVPAKDAGETEEVEDAGAPDVKAPDASPPETEEETPAKPDASLPTQAEQRELGEEESPSEEPGEEGEEDQPAAKRAGTAQSGGCSLTDRRSASPAWLGALAVLAAAPLVRRRRKHERA